VDRLAEDLDKQKVLVGEYEAEIEAYKSVWRELKLRK